MSQWNPSSGDWERAEPHWAQDQADPGTPGSGEIGWYGEEPERGAYPYGADGGQPQYPYSAPPQLDDPYPPPPTQPPPVGPAAPPMWEDPQPPKAYLWQQPQPPGPGRRTRTLVTVIAVGVFLVIGGAALAIEMHSHGGAKPSAHGSSAGPSQASVATTAPQATPTTVPTRARPSGSPSPGAGAARVAITRAAAANPAAPQVVNLLVSYFTSINTHNYPAFLRLFDPLMQRIEIAQKFSTGFRSTYDSGASLISLTTRPGGGLAAAVSFTSNQSPVDSPDHTACTNWAITLYLEHSGKGYLIGPPPASYRASHQPC
jgi:hypothetical protein